MTSCPETAPAPFACPTLAQSIQATAALLPRGRVWPASDPGLISRFLVWLAALGTPPATPAAWPAGYVQAGFIAALGTVRNWVESQICALKQEFWCATMSQTRDLWLQEYGLPDPCDPFPNLCAKVAATGGARCDYFTGVASDAGWVVDCINIAGFCGTACGATDALCGIASTGGAVVIGIIIDVDLEASPAYGGTQVQPLCGVLLAGMPLNCPPNIGPLQCVLDRILPAHLPIGYETF